MAEHSKTERYMHDRVDVRGIGAAAAAVVAAIVIGALGSWALIHLGNERAAASQAARPGHPPPIAAPVQLQTDPAAEIAAFQADKQHLLDSYGWVDREHGIARIPIDRAMAILARQGSYNVSAGAP